MDRLTRTAVAVGAFTGGTVIWQAVTARFVEQGGGCGWDGASYCAMAESQRVQMPFSRRPLIPGLVHLLHFGSVLNRFLFLDVLGLALATACVGALVFHLSGRKSAAVIAGSLLLLVPATTHGMFSYPANTDDVSLGLGLLFVLLLVRRNPWSVAVAPLVCLAREEWVVLVVVATVCDLLVSRSRWILGAVTAALAFGAEKIDFAIPHTTMPWPSTMSVIHQWLIGHFTGQGPHQLVWQLVFGFGLVPLLALPFLRQLARRETLIPLGVALTNGALGIVGGDDTYRLVLVSTAIGLALAVAAIAERGYEIAMALAVIGSVAIWRPWTIVGSKPDQFLGYFAPYYLTNSVFDVRFGLDCSIALGFLLVLLVVTWALSIKTRRIAQALSKRGGWSLGAGNLR